MHFGWKMGRRRFGAQPQETATLPDEADHALSPAVSGAQCS